MNKTENLPIREHIIRCSAVSGQGHIPTSFSVVEMIVATYSRMRHFPAEPDSPERDIFILSKGHAALGYYCCLSELGYFPQEDVNTFGSAGSRFGCHPDRTKCEGVEVSSGSLGHGIGIGVGMALAFKIQKSTRRVFVLVGDGESNEGSVWESLMVASNLSLSNFTILYDHNRSQKACLQIENPSERLRAFGCQTVDVDGHNMEEIAAAIDLQATACPKAIVCKTIKGKGCPTLVENVYEWHRKSPQKQELETLLKELYATTI